MPACRLGHSQYSALSGDRTSNYRDRLSLSWPVWTDLRLLHFLSACPKSLRKPTIQQPTVGRLSDPVAFGNQLHCRSLRSRRQTCIRTPCCLTARVLLPLLRVHKTRCGSRKLATQQSQNSTEPRESCSRQCQACQPTQSGLRSCQRAAACRALQRSQGRIDILRSCRIGMHPMQSVSRPLLSCSCCQMPKILQADMCYVHTIKHGGSEGSTRFCWLQCCWGLASPTS